MELIGWGVGMREVSLMERTEEATPTMPRRKPMST